jgi:hypothetical protein
MKRILRSLLVAALPSGSVLADAPKSNNAKETLVYQQELPNVPPQEHQLAKLSQRAARSRRQGP